MMRNRWLRCLCVFLSVSFVFTLAPSRLSADDDIANCYSVSENLEYDVDVSIVSSWDTYANLEFAFTNTGTETIHNWYFTFDLPYVVEGIWNAYIFETVNEVYTIKNAGWNQDILPGDTISFGMTVSSRNGQQIVKLPSYYLLNTVERILDSSEYVLSYQEYSNWGTGFNGALTLFNTSSEAIDDWRLSLVCNRSISEVAGATFSVSDSTIIISNDRIHQVINSGDSYSMTITGGEMNCDIDMQIDSITVSVICCAFSLTMDENNNGNADYLDYINESSEELIVYPTPTPIPDYELDSDEDGIPDFYEDIIGSNPYSKHSDNDGLEDGIELSLDLDPTHEDSDGDLTADGLEDDDIDGLTLLEEIELGTYTWTDDSDTDNIVDGDEVNIYGTYPLIPDSDEDGIKDGDELTLGTDPMVPDSDGDGIPDGQELFCQTRTEIITNEVRPEINKIEVSLEGTGCLDSAMSITDIYGKDVFSSNLAGLVGVPVEIEYSGLFETATITFYYDESQLGTTTLNMDDSAYSGTTSETVLGILWYDEDSGFYYDCNATVDVDRNSISCQTNHFSKYMLYDKSAWEFRWKYELNEVGIPRATNSDENGHARGIDYFIMFQYDASVTEEQRQAQHEFIFSVIDNLRPEDRVQFMGQYNTWLVGPYDTSIGFYPSSDKAVLKRYYDNLLWNEEMTSDSWCPFGEECLETDVGWVYLMTRGRFENIGNNGNEVVTICFSNSVNYSSNTPYYVDSARKGGYFSQASDYIVVLPGGRIQSQTVKSFEQWGSGIIECDKSDDPYWEFCHLYSQHQGEDNDEGIGDGLWDTYETSGMIGTNGQIYHSAPDLIDTDSDGLTDYDEIGSASLLEVDNYGNVWLNSYKISPNDDRYMSFVRYGMGTWNAYNVVSDPQKKDTDGDDYSDSVDTRPQFDSFTECYSLKHPYVAVKLKSRQLVLYGANQGDMYDDGLPKLIGPALDSISNEERKDIKEGGCGIISAADCFTYFSLYRPGCSSLFRYHGEDDESGIGFEDVYATHIYEVSQMIEIRKAGNVNLGVFGLFYYISRAKEYANERGVSLEDHIPLANDSYLGLLEFIKSGLTNDSPVIVLVGEGSLVYYDSLDALLLYDSNPVAGSVNVDSFSRHWINITGIKYDSNLKDYVVEFSTWGSKAYTTHVRLASYSSMLYFD